MYNEFMNKALQSAAYAASIGEVPVGAVVVKDGKIIAEGWNRRESLCQPTAHAEIQAIETAAKVLHSWRLEGCSIYVTLEPCPMCAGAIWNARISAVYFGAFDSVAGALCSVDEQYRHFTSAGHIPEIYAGIMEKECAELLQDFFRKRRSAQHIVCGNSKNNIYSGGNMKENVKMISVTENDTQELALLAADIWRECYRGIVDEQQVEYMVSNFQSAEALKSQLSEGLEYYFICSNSEQKVGYMCIRRENNNVFLSKFYIHSSQRGKGYGSSAMAWLKGLCLQHDFNSIYLTCNKYNQKALVKYHNMGFATTDSVVKDIGNGMVMDDYILTLTIDK